MKSQKIAVIGAGIMGLSAAYVLGKCGVEVCLYDGAGFPADNASFIAGGMLAPYAEIEHMNASWLAAGASGIAFWRDLAGDPGMGDLGFSSAGSLLLAHGEDAYVLDRFRQHLRQASDAPEGVSDLSDVRQYEPALADRFARGLYLGGEAHLDPAKTMAALCGALVAMGVQMVAEDARPADLSREFDYVIDARGMAAADDDAGLRAVKGELLVVRNEGFTLSRPVRLMHPRYPLYIVPRSDHVFMIGATQVESEGQGVSVRSGLELMSALYSLHPSFGDAEVLHMRSGLRPSYADNLPRITRRGNVLRCNGLFRHGFLLSPIMAQVVAAVAQGAEHEYYDLFVKEGDDESDCERAA